jgi:hypothetical protein
VVKAATATTVTPPATATAGQAATFTAHVTPTPANPFTPTGTVRFYLNGASSPFFSTALAADGTARVTTDALPAGAASVVAVYGGDAHFASSISPAAIVTVSPLDSPAGTTGSPALASTGADMSVPATGGD